MIASLFHAAPPKPCTSMKGWAWAAAGAQTMEESRAGRLSTVSGERARRAPQLFSCPESSAWRARTSRLGSPGAEGTQLTWGPDTVRCADAGCHRNRSVLGAISLPRGDPGRAPGARPMPRARRAAPQLPHSAGFTPFAKDCWGSPNRYRHWRASEPPSPPLQLPGSGCRATAPRGWAAGGACTAQASGSSRRTWRRGRVTVSDRAGGGRYS